MAVHIFPTLAITWPHREPGIPNSHVVAAQVNGDVIQMFPARRLENYRTITVSFELEWLKWMQIRFFLFLAFQEG